MTNVQKNSTGTSIPAGILSGVEGFYENGRKYVIINGTTMLFENAPTRVQNKIAEHCIADKQATYAIAEVVGTQAFSVVFDMWYRCRIGGLDSQPDFSDDLESFTPDAFNSQCTDDHCPMRGKLCNSLGLKSFHMPTVRALVNGYTVKETAARVHLSVEGVKSQVKVIKETLGARNTAHMVSILASKGIQPRMEVSC